MRTLCTCILQVKGLVAQLIHVKDVSTATGLEVTAGGKVCTYSTLVYMFLLSWLFFSDFRAAYVFGYYQSIATNIRGFVVGLKP